MTLRVHTEMIKVNKTGMIEIKPTFSIKKRPKVAVIEHHNIIKVSGVDQWQIFWF